MRYKILTTILSVGLTATSVASNAQSAPDAERLQAALAVERAKGGEAQIMKSLTAMSPGVINMLVQSDHIPIGRAAELWNAVILPGMQAHVGEIESANARILARHFTDSELTDLKNFYLSPTGQKLITEQSAIAVESVQSMVPFMQDVMKRTAQLAKAKSNAAAPSPLGAEH